MDARYPIGDFEMEKDVTAAKRRQAIAEISEAPKKLRAAVAGLNEAQLDTPYREGGWTVRQLVHHVADSHLNAYIRWRLTATEKEPTIKPYDEKQWADFVLQLECISNGKALNSGIFFLCIPDQYQNGYEAQIQNGYKDNDRTKPTDFGTGRK